MNLNFQFQDTLDLTSVFGEYIIHNLLDKVLNLKKTPQASRSEEKNHLEKLLKNHYIQIVNWSNNIEFFGLSKPQDTDEITLELSITTSIRKLNNSNSYVKSKISENDILTLDNNIIILGDPGAGKTTTLKRIVKKVINTNNKDIYRSFPIFIRLKDLKVGDSLFKKICDMLGLKYEQVEEKNPYSKELIIKYYVADLLIEDAVCHFLNEANIILILDGYDEIKSEIKRDITEEIEIISEKQSSNSKTIISCRSGDYHKPLRYFSICEICPLNDSQILGIVARWLPNSKIFFNELEGKPYIELINRPLFLAHILMLFIQKGELPNTSVDVYEKIISLLLKKWDNQRNIVRKSNYAKFDNEDKQKFLEDISYVLTYLIKTKVFDRSIFQRAYLKVYKKYELPKEEGELVADEIESHNGLIIKSFDDNYEFSHLVLQEYLCAKYLVTLPLNPKIFYNYLIEYPAPFAVCVSISKEPSLWFANFILRVFDKTSFIDKHKVLDSLNSFLNRVIFEKPKFNEDCVDMGLAMLYLFCNYGYTQIHENSLYKNEDFIDILERILLLNNVETNFISALCLFKPEIQLSANNENIKIEFHDTEVFNYDSSLYKFDALILPKQFLLHYVKKFKNRLTNYSSL